MQSSVRSIAERGRHARRRLVHTEVRDHVGREVFDELGQLVAVAGVDAAELGPTQPAARWNEVDADDLGRPRARFEQLRHARSQLATHPGDKDSRHDFASGRRCGNRITSRIEPTPASTITSRSTPMPRPPVGGSPYSSART